MRPHFGLFGDRCSEREERAEKERKELERKRKEMESEGAVSGVEVGKI
jgi:hypothetical protein